MAGVNIYENRARYNGGGIYLTNNASIIFNSETPCNIYGNMAQQGNDLWCDYLDTLYVVLDTFSVSNPTEFHAAPFEKFVFDIKAGKYEQTSEDLYISPEGDNDNDGLTQEYPLRTIHNALSRSLADSLNPQLIHLAEGTYNISSNGEFFPVEPPDNMSFKGAGGDLSILDAEGQDASVFDYDYKEGSKLSGLTVTGGKESGIHCSLTDLLIENVIVTGNTGTYGGGIYVYNCDPVLKNVSITNNAAAGGGSYYGDDGRGGGIYFAGQCSPEIINTTIADNTALYYGGGIYRETGWYGDGPFNANIMNCILWDNWPDQAYISTYWNSDTSSAVYLSYSDIMGGDTGIYCWDTTVVHWLEGNIDADPLFIGTGTNPYALSDFSPCIDAGTPDTTGLHLPLNDVRGGPRIWNERIDMGAYEWNTLGEEELRVTGDELRVMCYPNPVSNNATIEFNLPENGFVLLEIYDISGRKEQTLISADMPEGNHQVQWNAYDHKDGLYIIRLITDSGIATQKVMVMR